jgi:hypothetical protein
MAQHGIAWHSMASSSTRRSDDDGEWVWGVLSSWGINPRCEKEKRKIRKAKAKALI